MYNYKSCYKMKGLSVYGKLNFSILHKLDKFININKYTNVLIVNAKDVIYTLPFTKKVSILLVMKKKNIIVVFDKELKQTLMCKRTKEPYMGMYNLVGSKI